MNQLLLNLLTYTQEEVWSILTSIKLDNYTTITKLGKYIYFQHNDTETLKPLIVSHIDTINDMYDTSLGYDEIEIVDGKIKLIESSTANCLGGDDRVGNYIMLEMMRNEDIKADFLFTCYEEVGGEGAKDFSSYKEFNNWSCLIEIDRAGSNHMATYGYDNKELATILGLPIQNGSYTDIVDVARASGIAGYNVACGYYRQHTPSEYIIIAEVNKVIELLSPDMIDNLSTKVYTHTYKVSNNWYSYYKDEEEEDKDDGRDTYKEYDKCCYCGTYTYTNVYGFCQECMEEDWK